MQSKQLLNQIAEDAVQSIREAAEAIALEQNLEVERLALEGELTDVGDGFAAGAQVDYHYANYTGDGEIATFDVEGYPVYTQTVGVDKVTGQAVVTAVRKGVNEERPIRINSLIEATS
jgi:hypothetical protein